MTIEFEALSPATIHELDRDIAKYGQYVGKLSRHEITRLLSSPRRAERLVTWVNRFGFFPARTLLDQVRKETKRRPRVCLVGDTHCEPGQDFRRFRWLARWANEHLTHPDDTMVWLGDHYDMNGLFFRVKPIDGEGARYLAEKQAGDDGRDVFDGHLTSPCRKVLIPGNHGWRVTTWLDEHPYFEDAVYLYDQWQPNGWTVGPVRGHVDVHGFLCTHYVPNNLQKPISSTTGTARKALMDTKYTRSYAFGHSHKLSFWHEMNAGVMAVEAGCFFEHDDDYAGERRNQEYWRGIVLLKDVEDGMGDIETFHISKLEEMYGD